MRPHILFTTLSFSPHLKSTRPFTARALSSLRRDDDGTITISPADPSAHSASVILCHGLGDTADGWVDPARFLANKLPHTKFILPTAPTQPVTLNMGFAMPSWYDIAGLDSRSNELCEGLDESMGKILNLINEQVTNDNIDYSRIVLAGFSQGGALALYTGMTCNKVGEEYHGLGLAGIVLMSGYLPRASSFRIAEGSQYTPILHCHGRDDPMVMVDAVQLSKNRVLEMGGTDYETKIYPGLEHSVSMEELEDVTEFLLKVIPQKNDEL
ncbi:hypothetical protein ACHAXN_004629 [Cyclotella atomus]